MRRVKLILLGLATGTLALQLFNCSRFLGDLLGDALFLRRID